MTAGSGASRISSETTFVSMTFSKSTHLDPRTLT